MQKITLYRYIRPEGGVTVSPEKPNVDYTELYRLIADEGMTLTDGTNETVCTDTDTPDVWSEIPAPEEPEETEVTESDYQAALREFGVEV